MVCQGSGSSTLHLKMHHHHHATTSRCSTATLRCHQADNLLWQQPGWGAPTLLHGLLAAQPQVRWVWGSQLFPSGQVRTETGGQTWEGRTRLGSCWVLAVTEDTSMGWPGLGMESDGTKGQWQRGWRGKELTEELCTLQTHFSVSRKITSMEFCQSRPVQSIWPLVSQKSWQILHIHRLQTHPDKETAGQINSPTDSWSLHPHFSTHNFFPSPFTSHASSSLWVGNLPAF